MGDLDYELLAKAIAGEAVTSAIAETNPYTDFMAIPKSATDVALQIAMADPSRKNFKDSMAVGAVSGLLQGLLGGASRDYMAKQQGLANQVIATGERPEGISDYIWQVGQTQRDKAFLSNMADAAKRKKDLMGEVLGDITVKQFEHDLSVGTDFRKALYNNPRLIDDLNDAGIDINALDNVVKRGSAPTLARERQVSQQGIPQDIADRVRGSRAEAPLDLFAAYGAAPTASAEGSVSDLLWKDTLDITPISERTIGDIELFRTKGRQSGEKAAALAMPREASTRRLDEKMYDEIIGKRTAAKEMLNVTDTVQMALDAGLDTGTGAEFGQWVAENRFLLPGLAQALGFDAERASMGQIMGSVKAKVMQYSRPPGVGAQSNMEARQYLESAMRLANEPQANRLLIRRWRDIMNRDRDYADFVDTVMAEDGSIAEANRLWRKYEDANPFMATDEEGRLVPNPNIVSYKDFNFRDGVPLQGATPTPASTAGPELEPRREVGGIGQHAMNVVEGAASLPEGINALFQGETYAAMVQDPEGNFSPEQTARTVGEFAAVGAGTAAGAAKGAAVGATIGSVVPGVGTAIGGTVGGVIGAGLGGGLAYLGFDATEEAVRDLVGTGEREGFLPTKETVADAERMAGSIGAAGLFGKAAGRAASKTKNAAVRTVQNVMDDAKQSTLGVKTRDLTKTLERGVSYFDDAGNEIKYGGNLSDASKYQTQLSKAAQTLSDDGLFKKLPNNTKQVFLRFNQKMQKAGQQVGKVYDDIGNAINERWFSRSETWRKMNPLRWEPDFDKAQRVVNDIKKKDLKKGRTAQRYLDQEIEQWAKGPKSWSRLVEKKQHYSKVSGFDKKLPDEPSVKLVKQALSNTFNESIKATADFIGKGDDLAAANKTYSAYKTYERLIQKQGEIGRGELLRGNIITDIKDLPKRLALEKYPATTVKAGQALSGAGRTVEPWLQTTREALRTPASQIAPAMAEQYNEEDLPSVFSPNAAYADELEPKKKIEQMSNSLVTSDKFVSALIRQESDLDRDGVIDPEEHSATSPKGAVGVMQIMPKTWDWIGKDILGVDPKKYSRTNKEDNMMFGKAYLDWLDGYWRKKDAPEELIPKLVLASYNHGQGAVDGYVKKDGYHWPSIYRRLPSETKKYVKNIMNDLNKA